MKPYEKEKDEDNIWLALEKSGMKSTIEKHPKGLNAMMTKEFDEDGIELSGGQMQKIALARVFAKDSGIIVLDEPSSALDPISEYEMYKNILELSDNRTFIVISHRLSITKDVDRILFIENGEIIESGSHEELLGLGGKYSEMWNVQANKFK